jgi:peptidoglycan hydrolase CwlO-like protein
MNPMLLLESESGQRAARRREVTDMEESVQTQIARLTSDVQHIQKDVADIKVDLRSVNEKLGSVDARVYQVEQRLTEKIDGSRMELTEKIGGLRTELTEKIAELRNDMLSQRAWALGLYFALAGSLLLVMAKGFKWI